MRRCFHLVALACAGLLPAGPALGGTYHFDKVGVAQTVCTATTATTITSGSVSGSLTTLSNPISAAGDYQLRMDASGFNPTAGQQMYTPAFAACQRLDAGATVSLYARATWAGGTAPQWQARLYDVDPTQACGGGTLIGQSPWVENAGTSGSYAANLLTVANAGYTVATGHRVRIEVFFRAADGATGASVQYGQAAADSILTLAEAPCATTAGTAQAVVSGCSQITATAPFSGDGDADGSTAFDYNTTNSWPGTMACGSVSGASPRMCLIPGLAASTQYYVRAVYSDPDGLSGTATQVSGPMTTTACAGNAAAPAILFLSPSKNAVVGGLERFKVQVFDPDGVATGNVAWGLDGANPASAVAQNTNYDCNVGSQTACKVFEFDVDTTALGNGSHYVTVKAVDSASPAAEGRRAWPFVVNNSGTKAKGGGLLLRRTHGSQLCIDCHNLPTHSSQSNSFKYGSWVNDCTVCHTPHATNNIYLIRPAIETPSSGARSVDFRNTTGKADFSYATVTTPGQGVCEVCHTQTRNGDGSPRYRNTGGSDGGKHYSTSCTSCHTHQGGFGAGASNGNVDCLACHQFGMAISESSRSSTYHHVMEAGAKVVSGLTTYPTAAQPTSATADQDKTCVQCHADHNVFRPDVNTANTLGVGANLRTRIGTGPPTGNPPAPSAPGDASPGYYANRDYESTYAAGGICLSCHLSAQTKNTADQKSDGTTSTPAIVSTKADYDNAAHAYASVQGSFSGPSAFNVSCVKCHSDGTSTSYQNGTYTFTLHASANRRLLNPLSGATVDPLEESFCYRCHSLTSDVNPGGGPAKSTANRDYYNAADMAARTERLFAVLTGAGYLSKHNVAGTTAKHNPIEGGTAGDGTLSGANRHVECEDCHSPHAASKAWDSGTASSATATSLTDSSKNGKWLANQWAGYKIVITGGAGAGQTQAIASSTMAGVLNVASWSASAGQPNNTSTYRVSQVGLADVSGATNDVWGVSVAPGSSYNVGAATFADGSGTVHSGASGGIVTTASTGTTVTSSTRNWVSNAWKNYLFRAVTGASAGQTRTVTANAQTTLTVSSAVTLAVGDSFVVYSNGGTDTLYFKRDTEEAPAEPMPNAHQGADTFAGGTWIGRTMAPGAPTVAYEEKAQATNAINNWRMVTFTSPAVTTAVNIPAANWSLNVFCGESSTQQNAAVRYMIYKWNAADTLGTTIVARTSSGEIPINTTPPGTPFTITVAGSAVSLAAGDKIVVDLELYTNSTGAYTARYWWGAGVASYVVMPAPVEFGRPDPNTPQWSSSMAGGFLRNELDRSGRWYRITGVSQPTAGQAYYQAAITPSYSSSGASPLSNTKMTSNSGAQWYMDHGTVYSVSVPTLTRTASATKEYEVCLKCHSSWAYGDSPPNVPSSHQDGSVVAQTNVVNDFNSNQLGYHPVFAAGRNQPTAVSYAAWNSNAAYTRVDNTGSSASFGLSNTLTTGWFKESLLKCSDCHSSDSSSDPLGPHASGKKWVLKGCDSSVSWVRRNSAGSAWETIGNTTTLPGLSNSACQQEPRNLCWNCHRWDVYGYSGMNTSDAPASALSRIKHDPSGNQGNTYDPGKLPRSGIVCNQCHGGDRIGGIHGSSRGKFPFAYDPSTNTSTGIGGKVPTSYSGKRLLNGAYWYGVTRATTTTPVACWGKAGTDTVSLCAHGHAQDTGKNANYSYDDAADP